MPSPPFEPAIVERALDTLASGQEALARDAADVQRLWLLYAGNERNRSANRLARLSGVPAKRIGPLLPVFAERWTRETQQLRDIAEPYMQARVAGLVDAMVDRLQTIITTGSEPSAVAAIKVAQSILQSQGTQAPTVNIDARTVALVSDGLTSLEDVRRLVADNVNTNVRDVDHATSNRNNRPRDRSNG